MNLFDLAFGWILQCTMAKLPEELNQIIIRCNLTRNDTEDFALLNEALTILNRGINIISGEELNEDSFQTIFNNHEREIAEIEAKKRRVSNRVKQGGKIKLEDLL